MAGKNRRAAYLLTGRNAQPTTNMNAAMRLSFAVERQD